MIGFIVKRVIMGIGVLVTTIILILSIIYLAPVDPARLTFGQRSDNQTALQKQKELGLDKPLHIQMLRYLTDISPISIRKANALHKYEIFSFTMGSRTLVIKKPYLRESYQTGRPVSEMLKEAIPRTIALAVVAFFFATIIGVSVGVIAALVKGTWWDTIIIGFSTIGISVPSYVSAIFFSLLFGFVLHEYTGLQMQGGLVTINDIGDDVVAWQNLILPALALGLRPVSIIVQLSRGAMLDVLSSGFVKTARSKGLSMGQVVYRHALRNAMNPIVTALTGWFASLLAGAFFVEKVFNYRGIGEMTINGLLNYDVPVILACVIFIAAIFVLANILNDTLYRLIDPRLRANF